MDRTEALKTIAAQASHGDLAFPTSTRVALRVKEVLDDPDCHMETAAKLVQSEPLLAARVVAVANSVAYNPSGREIADVRTACSRLGFGTLRSLATGLAARQMTGPLSKPEHRAMAEQLWQHTTQVAALARVIAKRVTHLDGETALFSAILHEVGSFYLLSRLGDFPDLLEGDGVILDEEAENEISRAVLGALSVPESIASALEDFWQGYLALPPKSLGDTLLLADSLASTKSPLHELRNASEDLYPTIELCLGEETLAGILQESAEEIQSLIDALKF